MNDVNICNSLPGRVAVVAYIIPHFKSYGLLFYFTPFYEEPTFKEVWIMQLSVTFSGKNINMPFASSQIYQGLIYKALTVDQSFADKMHNEGSISLSGGERGYKLFTFGETKGRKRVDTQEKTITFHKDLTIEIRSPDAYFIQLLITYFARNPNVMLGKNQVEVKDFTLSDRAIKKEKVEIKTISPITVHWTIDKKTVYFSPEEEQFYTSVITNAKRKWESYKGSGEGFDFNIYSVENTEYKKVATTVKDICATGYHGNFILEGPSEVLDFLYQSGLGTKNSYGFGMFEEV